MMRYLPWDRLQISDNIYNHTPVRKAEIVYPLYKGYHSTFAHVPHFHKNLSIYTTTLQQKIDVLESFEKDNAPVQKFSTIALFDLSGSLENIGHQLEAKNNQFEYHPYHASFEMLLADFLILRHNVRKATREAGLAQSHYRRVYTIIVYIDATMQQELKHKPKLQAALKELLQNSADENMYFVMLTDQIFIHDLEFFHLFDQEAFVGEENMDFALHFFDHLDEGNISMIQEHIGWGRRINSARFTSLHPRKYTPSQWLVERQEAIAAEEDAYAKFLASLSAD